MKIAPDVLARFVAIPAPAALRVLLDSCGLEVKRVAADGVFTLELLANRGDHHCYEGVAREISGRTGAPLALPVVADLAAAADGSTVPVRISSPACLLYSLTLLERSGPADALDAAAMRLLEAAGLHSVTGPVDATNVANLELGQPTHAFDADTIVGSVHVRESVAGETAVPLFRTEPVDLPVGTLVIADDEKVLAIAGVIGCEGSKTTAATTRVLLESATFDPIAVRKASRALGIHTDSSARFERGADPEDVLVGAGRVVHLLEASGGWRRVGATDLQGAWRNPGRVVSLTADGANTFLGTSLPVDEIAGRLIRYGFRVRVDGDQVHASVPSGRLWDVAFPADLYEELAKSVGYDETPIELPPIELGALPSVADVRKGQTEEVLLGHGFYEVFTDGFYGRNVFAQLGIPEGHPLARHVETTNAVERSYSLVKNNALHQALEAVAINERRRTTDVKMYEWTRTFHPIDDVRPARPLPDRPPCSERRLLWLIAAGNVQRRSWQDPPRLADVWFLKGLLAELGTELQLDLEVGAPGEHPLAEFLHPGRHARIVWAGETVGVFGEVHPAVVRRYKIKAARPCYLEVDANVLFSEGIRPRYVEPSSVQPLIRSLAFALPLGVEAGDVAAMLHANGPEWLASVRIVDQFDFEQAGAPWRAVTFEIAYAPGYDDAPRTADDVNAATETLTRALLEQFGPRGVRQR